jgi:hypothetical protein
MKRHGNWLECRTDGGGHIVINLQFVREVRRLLPSGVRVFNAHNSTTHTDIQGTFAEWQEVVMGVAERVDESEFRDSIHRSGYCVAEAENGWFICGKNCETDVMEPRYPTRSAAMDAVEALAP